MLDAEQKGPKGVQALRIFNRGKIIVSVNGSNQSCRHYIWIWKTLNVVNSKGGDGGDEGDSSTPFIRVNGVH